MRASMTLPRPVTVAEVDAWLRTRFALRSLRASQADVVFRLLRGERVLFVAPTGHGKSLCFQAVAANPWTNGVVLVFTPLKALMAEQVTRALAQGLRAELLNSEQDADTQAQVFDAATAGTLDMLFIAPERLGNTIWKDRIPHIAVKAIVIDEAHCISQWGHDFRPWYRRLVKVMTGLGLRTPVLAVTATAPGRVITDVVEQIAPPAPRPQPTTVRLPSVRPNISHVVWAAAGVEQRLAFLALASYQRRGQPGIAYFVTQAEAEQASRWLQSQGFSAVAYHAGLEPKDKEAMLTAWRSGAAEVVCSTSALGMGVDRADVRWVLHAGLPSSLIQYVQEFGRAGRDGQPAWAIALDDPSLKDVHLGMLRTSAPIPADYTRVVSAVSDGRTGRTRLVEQLDLPERYVQRLLDDLVEAGALLRQGSPAKYSPGAGSLPTESEDARRVRVALLEEAMGWAASLGCRRVTLANAMGDVGAPPSCGTCDRCMVVRAPDISACEAKVRAFLDQDRAVMRAHESSGLSEGVALSWYGLGDLGRAVQEAKRSGRVLPESVFAAALDAMRRAPLRDLRPTAILYLPPTRSGDFVRLFAEELGRRLSLPAIGLEKTRATTPQKQWHARHNKERNVKGALTTGVGTPVQGNLLLVDDIWDSGATMREAARLVKRPGRTVRALVLARTRHSDDQ
jgi:ATP-dependent DNA helicase RecQ